MRQFVLKKNYYFLAEGTVLKQDVEHTYFVSMSDDDWMDSNIIGSIRISRLVVENTPDIFEEVEWVPPKGVR